MADEHSPPVLGAPFKGLTRERMQEILERIRSLKVGVIGDGCLDLYWDADMTISELSRETPHYNMPVARERFAPGAASNAAVNFKLLGCAEVSFCTVIGDDWRGGLLKEALRSRGVDGSLMLAVPGCMTPAYCKVIMHGLQGVRQEAPRIDFTSKDTLTDEVRQQLLTQFDLLAERVDVIGVTDQLEQGVIDPSVRERLRYWAGQGKRIVVDSRYRIGDYASVVLKPNEVEALRWFHGTMKAGVSDAELFKAGLRLSQQAGSPCCITVGEKGAYWFEDGGITPVPTSPVAPPVDIVGAGDSFTAAFLAAYGIGCSGPEAAAFAHLAAAVSVRKLGETGGATPQEMWARWEETTA
ncbi:bifunctional heptose 7-phosphate kinase/heptose 1-phosphate adenyltransferase [Paenibacillus thalictri]|uniref:Sugar kinase n=1 Tax=Paenibacillus thalictri TaxID=2527873 RepID=A0A4Q9DMR2_9BACL|nr:PfkB family carbohydrate kinase [Paenibacillus thalictri]TBL75020.1 sugar kinase [Paenibacillus thalictri]